MITNGVDGLKVVAETGGSWNWVLLGPNPETLPLAGGGAGGVEEMQECIRKTEDQCGEANLYGALRMEFGTGKLAKRKFVFVRASKLDDDWKSAEKKIPGRATIIGHGHAGAQRGEMEKAINQYLHTIVLVEVHSVDELTLELVLDKLSKASTADADMITTVAYKEALEELHHTVKPAGFTREIQAIEDVLAAHAPKPEVFEAVQEGEEEEEEAKGAANESGVPEEVRPLEAPQTAVVQESSAGEVSKFREGALVACYSSTSKKWLDDGVVVKALSEGGIYDNMQLAAGSIKVCYNNRNTYKWLLPDQVDQFVRPSGRPRPPQSLYGELFKETHNWITSWHVRYFDLSKGYLQWWASKDEAKKGAKPNGGLYLAGMEMVLEGTIFRVRTRKSGSITYAFDATTPESAAAWQAGFKAHEEYVNNMAKYLSEKTTGEATEDSDVLTEQIKQRRDSLEG